VLADPLVQVVMRRDGVSLAALKSIIAHAQISCDECGRSAPPPRRDHRQGMLKGREWLVAPQVIRPSLTRQNWDER
jgi:hypothetical protein